jgi:glucose uptake protein
MIIPSTYAVTLLLTIVTMICWGSWANTTKLAGRWRFELFYFDYSFGVLLAAAIAALTFGSLGDDLSVLDNLSIVGRRPIFYGFLGGVVFNLANILLVAAITVAGLAVAFPIGIGLALVIGVVWNYFLNPQANPSLLFTGAGIVVAAIIVDAIAYGQHGASKAAAPPPPHAHPKGPGKPAPPKRSPAKGILLSLVSGLLMGTFYPLVEISKRGEIGLGPYSVGLVFSVGVFLSTFFFNLYFMNLPVQGPPTTFAAYFKGTRKQHLLGIAGGLIWCIGTISNFAASSAPKEVNVGPAVSYALGQGATAISALWGLLYWKEFAGATSRVKGMLWLMMILFVAGLVLVSVAPLFK